MSKEAFVFNLENNDEYQPILNGQPQTCGMRSGRVYLENGKSCGQHSTHAHEEILVFLSGNGEALVGEDNKSYQVGKGKTLYIPPHTLHDIKNSSKEPLVYIYCVAPIGESAEEMK
ncbi:MAG: cupin domain-containing protein [Bacteroidales bacterium]|nr:cupin domain-containing protein [Bacteroidales bacterium]